MDPDHIEHPLLKALAALWAFAVLHWPSVFAFLTGFGRFCAALTAIAIFCEWAWKKVIRPRIRR
jgi:hypothetical protein